MNPMTPVRFMYLLVPLLTFPSIRIDAYNENHGPFDPGDPVELVPVLQMVSLPNVGLDNDLDDFRFVEPGGGAAWIDVWADAESGIEVRLVNEGRQGLKKRLITDFAFPPGIDAYTADFNQDGQPDFVIYAYYGGNGVNVGACRLVFLLSGETDYSVCSLDTFFPDPPDFVVTKGKPCFVQAGYFGWEEGFEWQTQSCWVYNLVEFEGTNARVNNNLHPDFPKIVWCSSQPDQAEAAMPTPSQKQELIQRAQSMIFGESHD